jgi:hypothetical protein
MRLVVECLGGAPFVPVCCSSRFLVLVPELPEPLAVIAGINMSCSASLPVCPALPGAPKALQQLQNELQELQPGIVLAGRSERELRGMRKNLQGVSSADDDEERYLDEEAQQKR